jgi:hypothetical protein
MADRRIADYIACLFFMVTYVAEIMMKVDKHTVTGVLNPVDGLSGSYRETNHKVSTIFLLFTSGERS